MRRAILCAPLASWIAFSTGGADRRVDGGRSDARERLPALGRARARLSANLSACFSTPCACARQVAAARELSAGSAEDPKAASASSGRSLAYLFIFLSHSRVCSANIMIRCLRKNSESSSPGGGLTVKPPADPGLRWKGSCRYSRISALFHKLGGGSLSSGDFFSGLSRVT